MCKFIFQTIILSHPAAIKALSPGRVVIVNHQCQDVLGVVLRSSTGTNNERSFTVLIICDKDENDNKTGTHSNNTLTDQSQSSNTESVKPVIKTKVFQPEGPCWHKMVQYKSEDIAIVTTKNLRIDADKIMADVRKREQPRFRYEKSETALFCTCLCISWVSRNRNLFPQLKMLV